ncbi:hypothetical protein [Mesorhizobium sp.]|uniref:hypothetical protein n=1 Tax=Mesorhizobium sp. TaxID=1871066 RepID=UPI00345C3A89
MFGSHVAKAVVRVGITQYPAGLGVTDAELKPALVDACANIRMETKPSRKVYRHVTKWNGNAVDESTRPSTMIDAWKKGHFEGRAMFS